MDLKMQIAQNCDLEEMWIGAIGEDMVPGDRELQEGVGVLEC